MKRIFLFMDSLGAGGAQRQLTGLAVMLKNRGYAVKVVTYYDLPFYKYVLDDNCCEYECLNVSSKLCLPKLIRSIRHFKTNVVISYQTTPNALACVAAVMTGVRLIVSERNTHFALNLKDKLVFQLYRRAYKVVPNSYSEGGFIRGHFPFLADKTVVISNFVDLNVFTPVADKKVVRDFLVVASVKASKNTKNFIRAVRMAKDNGCDIKVKWYGVNPSSSDLPENVRYARECLDMVKTLGLEESIRLLPKRKDIQSAYREAGIFCLPSLFEGTPNVICEAMASGLPVIASRVCDNSHYVHDGENGILFNPDVPESIANAIMNIYGKSDEELRVWGLRSRDIAEEICSEESFVNKYIELIEK